MKAIGEVLLWAGEHAIFGPEVAASLVGQKFPGGKALKAEQQTQDTILLTVEIELPSEMFDSYSKEIYSADDSDHG